MTGDARHCPEPEVLAAFVAGTLAGDELKATIDHIRDCEECREVVAASAMIAREEPRLGASSRTRRIWPWWVSAVAAALAATAYLTVVRAKLDPIHILVAAAPRDERLLEPRLTGGFVWAPLRAARRGALHPLDSGEMKFIGAAGDVLDRTTNDSSPQARHAAALAHLVAGRPTEAAELLASLARNGSDSKIWSDLAAARYAVAVQTDDPSALSGSLAAADAALRLAPKLDEAHFNRALVLERLGLREEARRAWLEYLAGDSSSPWAVEAKRHLAQLVPASDFRDELRGTYEIVVRDPAAARALAAKYPQDARVWGETEILGRWAEAVVAGDDPQAAKHLGVARAFGDELAAVSGERMLAAAVTAIEQATPPQRIALARGHLAFRKAQTIYSHGGPAEAEPLFRDAALRFEAGGSPLALSARYFASNTAFDQGRIEEALRALERLSSNRQPAFPAFHAQVEWQLGLGYASMGRWGDTIRSLSDSLVLFERIGERRYATTVRELLAEVYDRIGDSRTAWRHRLVALQGIGRTDNPRLQVALDSIASAAAMQSDWLACVSFLTLERELTRRTGDDFRAAQTLALRARAEAQLGRRGAAAYDLAECRRVVGKLHDPALRERAEADRLAAAGFLAQSPADAVMLLGRAVEFHRRHGRRMLLPEMFLQRGRALLALQQRDAAAADFEDGIRELEQQRTSLDAGELRWGVFAPAEEIFDAAVMLALDRADDDRAFQYLERARSRQLLEAVGETRPAEALLPVSKDVLIVEYAALPARLIIFIVDGGRVHAVRREVSRHVLEQCVDALARSAAARDEDQFRRVGATLYEHILSPVADKFSSRRTLVFVPDATLRGVPFAALVDANGHYLVERHSVVVTPSTAVFRRLAMRRFPKTRLHVLLVAGPSAGEAGLDDLSSVSREVAEIAAMYGPSATIAPANADAASFKSGAPAAEIIHFVGHAVTSDGGRDAALVVSRSAGAAGRLDMRGIASLALRHTRVVVLAACSSARGEELTGEGGLSVARAFLAAGVPSVVATLWPIRDAAAAGFFPRLHRHLADGLAPAEALRATQLECIRRHDAPLDLWAAVQVLGS